MSDTRKRRRRMSDRKQPSLGQAIDAFAEWLTSGKAKEWAKNVSAGADPIEALHGHVCGPTCWHEQMKTAFKTRPT